MFPIREFEKRFREILDCADEIKEEHGGEEFEELNADFEDALFVIECIDADDEDWREAFSDALEELKDLCDAYRKLSSEVPELAAEAERLDMAVQMAQANLAQ